MFGGYRGYTAPARVNFVERLIDTGGLGIIWVERMLLLSRPLVLGRGQPRPIRSEADAR